MASILTGAYEGTRVDHFDAPPVRCAIEYGEIRHEAHQWASAIGGTSAVVVLDCPGGAGPVEGVKEED